MVLRCLDYIRPIFKYPNTTVLHCSKNCRYTRSKTYLLKNRIFSSVKFTTKKYSHLKFFRNGNLHSHYRLQHTRITIRKC